MDLGVKFNIPKGYWIDLQTKSGLAAAYDIQVPSGVVDEGYRGLVKAILYNSEQRNVQVSPGNSICQEVLTCCPHYCLVQGEVKQDTDWGGSGGVNKHSLETQVTFCGSSCY